MQLLLAAAAAIAMLALLDAARPDTTETRLLQFLVEARRRTVDEATRQCNRLTDCLKLYFRRSFTASGM